MGRILIKTALSTHGMDFTLALSMPLKYNAVSAYICHTDMEWTRGEMAKPDTAA